MRENKFQSKLIKEIKDEFPGCIIMKNDSSYIQGIPDLMILHQSKWASLECKKDEKASKQPNQECPQTCQGHAIVYGHPFDLGQKR